MEEPGPPRRGSHVGVVGLFNLQTRLMELHRQWELLREDAEKGIKLLQTPEAGAVPAGV